MEKGKVIDIENRIPKLKEQKKQKSNKIFIFYVFIFFILILLVIYFQSSFSKVSSIEISGNRYVTEETIIQSSGITFDHKFLNIKEEKVSNLIETNEEISHANVQKKFPNKVVITVEEYSRIAYLIEESSYLPILETGKILDNIKGTEIPSDAPLLVNWEAGYELQEMAAELKNVPESIKNRISEIYHDPISSDPLHIQVFMTDGYEVSATVRKFSSKIKAYPSIVSELPEDSEGVIHLEVGSYFKAYQQESDENVQTER